MENQDKKKLSPMMVHYHEIKKNYQDAILLYRLGDFYECFEEDAIVVSEALDLVLTGRNCGLDDKAPMCGVPAHALDSYLSKLVQKGFKVAICEQISRGEGTKLFEREVLRVVTPGTVIEESILNSNNNNYLACVYIDEKTKTQCSIAYVDISTGEFYCMDISGHNVVQKLNDELVRINPAEIICNYGARIVGNSLAITTAGIIASFDKVEEWYFDELNATNKIVTFYNLASIHGLDIAQSDNNIKTCGAILQYLKQTQKRDLSHLKMPKVLNLTNFMYLDSATLRNLEIVSRMRDGKVKGSLLDVIDYTKTSMGARKLKSALIQPLQDEKEINKRLDSVQELFDNNIHRLSIAGVLSNIADLERMCSKIVYRTLLPKDCIALKDSLHLLPQLKNILSKTRSKGLLDINERIEDLSVLEKLIFDIIAPDPPATTKDGGYIKTGYNEVLDKYRDLKDNSAENIRKLQEVEIQETGIKTLKIKYNKVFGYFIEIPSSMIDKVPVRYIRKQTISNSERYVTEELKQLEEDILNAQEKSHLLEAEIYTYLLNQLANNVEYLQKVSQAIAELDMYISFAIASDKNNYTRPQISQKEENLIIKECRHPVVEQLLMGTPFVCNDVSLNNANERIMIITGPNMAGKSTYMREVALSVIMAHIGCFVPAKMARIPIMDRIFTRVGASDDLSFGQSTFMVEMVEVANILNNATNNSLIVLDEVGRGTATYDGLSIAWAIMEYLSSTLKAKTLFATHYFELTELEGMLDGVKNYRVSVKEINDTIVFLRKIVKGPANKSFGIQVASLAGVPKVVTSKAKEILKKLEVKQNLSLSEVDKTQVVNVINQEDKYSDIINEIKEISPENITPIMALQILSDLVEKVNNKE